MTRGGPTRPEDGPLVSGPPIAGLPYKYVALAVVSFGVFLSTMDSSIVNVALPTLAREFDTTVDHVLWVTLAFILVAVGLSLSMGRLGDVYGRKRIYGSGFFLFTVATALAAGSQSLPMLLVARVVQAIGAAMVVASGSAIITASFPASQRGRALGIMGGTVGAGLATGPVLGGILVEAIDWRAIFWARIPLGLVGSMAVFALVRDTPPEDRPRGLDIPGAALLFGMLFTLVLGVNRGDAWGWSSGPVVALFTAGVAMTVAFIRRERAARSPVVDLELFKVRSFSAAILTAILQFVGLAGIFVLMPFFLIQARGFSQLETGGIMAAMPLTMFVVAPLSGILADRTGPRVLTTVALVIVTGGLVFAATMDADTSVAGIVLRLIVIGAGTAIFQSPNTSAVMGSVPPQRLGTASASVATSRQVGQSIGIAIAGALFAARSSAFAEARSPLGLDDPAVMPEALVAGLELAFLVGAAITALGIFSAWSRGGVPARAIAPPPTPIAEAAAGTAATAGGPTDGAGGT